MRVFNLHQHQLLFGALLVLAISSVAQAEPAKAGRRHDESQSLRPQYRAVAIDEPAKAEVNASNATDGSSSGRLFMKKFFFKNMFGNTATQPIIPIIVTGGAGGTTTTTTGTGTPTTTTQTVTTTGSIPTASGIISTTPTTGSPTTGSPTTGTPTVSRAGADDDDEEEAEEEDESMAAAALQVAEPQQVDESAIADEQALQAALAAGAQEYVVTNEEIRGTSDAKSSKQPARINLRRKGVNNNKSQVISVRVPARYRRYFKKGQRVMLNTNVGNRKRRPGNKRIIRKRVNKNRRKKVKRNKKGGNKKRVGTRIVAA